MKPIAQTFLVSEPEGTGVEAVFLTSVDLYFKSTSASFGIELQIRDTVNGVPSVTTLPYASKILQSLQVSTSIDGTVATKFTFDTPVILRTNEQFAMVLIPVGGNPDYTVWTAMLGEKDVSSGVPIFTNNQLGNLFLSTNDLNFTPVQNESMKYNLRIAQFSATSAQATYKNSNTDFFRVFNISQTFFPNEQVVISNNVLSLAAVKLGGSGNTFTVGEYCYQTSSGASPNTALGLVYFANSSTVKFSNLVGAFANTGNTIITGATSGKIATITSANQSIVTTTSSNTLYVPDISYSDFTNGNIIYVGSSTRSLIQIVKVTGNNPTTNAILLDTNLLFTDSACIIGRVKGDAGLHGYLSALTRKSFSATMVLDAVTANSTVNFANTTGYLIGRSSGASASVISLVDLYYNSVTSQFTQIIPSKTSNIWGFTGASSTKTSDTGSIALQPDTPYEFTDSVRRVLSRSNEFNNPVSAGTGNSSFIVQATLSTSNTKISPYIDRIRSAATLTTNSILPASKLFGFRVSISNPTGLFKVGDTVWQSNSTQNSFGVVSKSNTSSLVISSISTSNTSGVPSLVSNSSSIITDATTGAVANVTSVIYFDESDSFPSVVTSRYISKNVILSDKQDADDLVCYLTAYRPPQTNFQVYGKVSAASDTNPFANNVWSILSETTSTALISSSVNVNDYVELVYELPSSVSVYTGGISCNTTSNVVILPTGYTSSVFTPGSFIYLSDASFYVSGASVAAAGTGYVNGDIVQLTGTAGYLNSNATFSVLTNSSSNVVSVIVQSPGNYMSNAAITANTTANNSGSGTGLLLSSSGSQQLSQSQKFNVRYVTSIQNSSALTVDAFPSIVSSNVAVGIIPGLTSKKGAFRYTVNNGVARYVTAQDTVYDTFKVFAMKIVFVSNNTSVIPKINDMRCLALQV